MADKRTKVTSIRKEKAGLSKIKQLEEEVARLKQENDLLKKWHRFLAERHQKNSNSSQETEN